MTFYETVRAKASEALREFLMDAPADAYVGDVSEAVENVRPYLMFAEATDALTELGILEAVSVVVCYEQDTFGKVFTDLSNPTDVAAVVYQLLVHEAVDAAVSKLGLPDDKVLTPRELVKLDRIMQDEMLADDFLNDAWLRLPTQGEK